MRGGAHTDVENRQPAGLAAGTPPELWVPPESVPVSVPADEVGSADGALVRVPDELLDCDDRLVLDDELTVVLVVLFDVAVLGAVLGAVLDVVVLELEEVAPVSSSAAAIRAVREVVAFVAANVRADVVVSAGVLLTYGPSGASPNGKVICGIVMTGMIWEVSRSPVTICGNASMFGRVAPLMVAVG